MCMLHIRGAGSLESFRSHLKNFSFLNAPFLINNLAVMFFLKSQLFLSFSFSQDFEVFYFNIQDFTLQFLNVGFNYVNIAPLGSWEKHFINVSLSSSSSSSSSSSLLLLLCIYSQCLTGNQFLVQLTSYNLSTQKLFGGFVLFLIRQSFEFEPQQDSPLCFQDGRLILLGLSQVPLQQQVQLLF